MNTAADKIKNQQKSNKHSTPAKSWFMLTGYVFVMTLAGCIIGEAFIKLINLF